MPSPFCSWCPCVVGVLCGEPSIVVRAHSGPPYPILSNRIVGPVRHLDLGRSRRHDDGSAAGQFWVMLQPAAGGGSLPAGTHADVSIEALDAAAPRVTGRAQPVDNEISRQFAALVLDHEGRFGVAVTVDGPLGRAEVETTVDATFDLRPAPIMMVVYLMPFVLVGFLWVKLLVRRRRTNA